MLHPWLPDKKYYEFSYHKFFNPDVTYENWTPWDEWTYPDRDLLRFSHIIKDQIEYIKDKKVLDLACHLGYLSLFSLHNGAKFVTGTNVRKRELGIANEVCKLAGFNNYQFIMSDIYDHKELINLVNSHDTIILSGVFYHINNHYELLKILCQPGKTIIIETELSLYEKTSTEIDLPAMLWRFEETSESTNAYEENKDFSFVGYPNEQWITAALENLNMSIEYNKTINYFNENKNKKTRLIIRAKYKDFKEKNSY